jgi:hypothetical protein
MSSAIRAAASRLAAKYASMSTAVVEWRIIR